MLLFYATHDGQARRISAHIAGRLAQAGTAVQPHDLSGGIPDRVELDAASLVVVVAAVRYGRHLPQAERLFAACRDAPVRLALISVNLTARKPGKDTAEGNRYVQKTITRFGLRPVLAAAVAGRLDYQRYGWRDRQIIRLIMKLTGGPTHPKTCVEFTDWDAVNAIAARILETQVKPADHSPP